MDVLVGLETNFGTNGQYILRAMQDNNEVPLVDLFVRESLQNSLDAGNKNGNPIRIEYLIGEFDKERLNEELNGSKDKLNLVYKNKTYKYIAIKDSNTTGLDGKLLSESFENDVKGNFQKLVFGIGEPQDNEESGGSWGLGKTVYFRLGIGLVIYYSQYYDVDGKYKSRLAATLVESTNNIKFLPDIEVKAGNRRTGAVWWGRKAQNENQILPITDINNIKQFLSIFNISPFGNQETGTIIIIPYIDEKTILEKNQFVYGSEDNTDSMQIPTWNSSLEESISKSVCRWFFPRMKKGYSDWTGNQYCKIFVNGQTEKQVEVEGIFKLLQEFYLLGVGKELKTDSFCKHHNIIPTIKDITLDGYFLPPEKNIGKFVYTKITNTEADIFPIKPYYYLNFNNLAESKNIPIIPFVRKPGMIIDYNLQSAWTAQDYSLNEDEYIVGIFILNSHATLKERNLSLDEYIRQGEKSQHTRWIDQDINGTKNRIVHNIEKKIRKELISDFSVKNKESPSYIISDYSRKFSSFLPPRGFGTGAGIAVKSIRTGNGNGKKRVTHPKFDKGLLIDYDNIKYLSNSLKIPCKLINVAHTGIRVIELHVMPLNKDESSLSKWAEQKISLPFEICAYYFKQCAPKISPLKTDPGKKVVGFSFDTSDFSKSEIDLDIEITIYNNDYTPALVLK